MECDGKVNDNALRRKWPGMVYPFVIVSALCAVDDLRSLSEIDSARCCCIEYRFEMTINHAGCEMCYSQLSV